MVKKLLSHEATTQVYRGARKMVERKTDIDSTTRVEAEILENHLMKATISLPALNVKYTIFADEPAAVGGHGEAPFMFGYFMAGAALCELAQYTWNAAELGLVDTLQGVKLTLEGAFPLAPLYGLNDAPGASTVTGITVTSQIESDATPEQIETLARHAAARCPAHQSLVNHVAYRNTVELNGTTIAEFSD